ncbi:MAG: cation:proton antiporter [Planctomycetes bacterium]|nr:cation:proton antiporter [Planctomycetota bacterium]
MLELLRELRSSLDGLIGRDQPILLLALLLLAGRAFGMLAKKVHLPSVTGQILIGFLLGGSGLGIIQAHATEALHPFTLFALGLISVTVGSHLSLRRLRNAGRRLVYLVVLETLLIWGLVFGIIRALDLVDWPFALLLGAVAISTAPATVVALVKEARAKGVFIKTLVAAVALNNIACVLAFEMARAVGSRHYSPDAHDLLDVVAEPARQLVLAALIGAVSAAVMIWITRRTVRSERLATAAMATILLVLGLADVFGVSPMLACLFLGVAQANITPNKDEFVDSFFSSFEPAILAVFFAMAGSHLHLESLVSAGLITFVFFAIRLGGKLIAVEAAMRLARAPRRIRRNLGMALVPQAGVAIGLVVLVQDDPTFDREGLVAMRDLFVTAVLACVTLNEVVGPILTRIAIARSGEANRDRPRAMDFIQEENIVVGLEAADMREAIEKLTDLLIRSHHLVGIDRAALVGSILEREDSMSTCLGDGVAVPHGRLPDGSGIVGVLGLSQRGLPFATPDGRPVHAVVLLATPDGERDRHLEVLAAIARMIGSDPTLRESLFDARSSAHAYEILHNDAAEDFNHYLDEPEA